MLKKAMKSAAAKKKILSGMKIFNGLKYVMERRISSRNLRPSRNILIFDLPLLGA